MSAVSTLPAPQLASAAVTPTSDSRRSKAGLLGIFIAAMMAGLNNRVGALALADIRGALGVGLDDASWLTTVYTAGELIAMPFAAWFAITLSVRRFALWMLGTCALLAIALPFIQALPLLLALRFMQGVSSGTMIPLLMMAALKFLPVQVRLYGLALYAMTATFAPNLSIWLAGYWSDGLFDWRWVYWQIVPLALISGLLVGWGLPLEAIQAERFRRANWLGMACGVPALGLLALVLDQGIRLDWFQSPVIVVSAMAGCAMLVVYLLTEWYHPSPFIQLQILGRRNLGLGFILFVLLLVVLMSGALLPANYLGRIQDYRPMQMASIGLVIALPQLILGPLVARLLYQQRVDARVVFSLGLFLIALACLSGAALTPEWNREQFLAAQMLHAVGQPMAIVPMLVLVTGVVQPHEGPYVSGAVNTLRALGSLVGAAVVGQLLSVRSRFHTDLLLDRAALTGDPFDIAPGAEQLAGIVSQQALVLSVADAYRALGILAILLIPLVLCLTYIPAPQFHSRSSAPAPLSTHG